MTSTNAKLHRHQSGPKDVAVEHADNRGSTQEALVGKGDPIHRPRFTDVFPAGEGSVCTGSIAVSFAVVSRKRWPLDSHRALRAVFQVEHERRDATAFVMRDHLRSEWGEGFFIEDKRLGLYEGRAEPPQVRLPVEGYLVACEWPFQSSTTVPCGLRAAELSRAGHKRVCQSHEAVLARSVNRRDDFQRSESVCGK